MENNIPTAKNFLKENANEITYEEGEMFAADVTPYMLITFAKMHVQAALKSALENVKVSCDSSDIFQSINEKSILNAYPENLIK